MQNRILIDMDARKLEFESDLKEFVQGLGEHTSTKDGQWTVKGFIDTYKNVYTISSDTKIVSKILEIHLFPQILKFAEKFGYKIVPTNHQNYYPDISFVSRSDEKIRFAVDLKTTYRTPDRPNECNGFTLGSHGEYFRNRTSKKNIQFPYGTYQGHFCLGIIYSRAFDKDIDETSVLSIENLDSITSVVRDFDFFVAEKWKIASDKPGSGNTANIGSIKHIPDIISGQGIFCDLGEHVFDDYWINHNIIETIDTQSGKPKKIRNLKDFLNYRGIDASKIRARTVAPRKRKTK
jgi:Restriction endonuclease EcoRV